MKIAVRILLSTLLGLCVIGFVFCVSFWFGADSFLTKLNYELSEDESYYVVTGVKIQGSSHIKIPATHNGLPVAEIGDEAFGSCYGLKKLTIPESIKKIGACAYDNTSINKVVYQGNVEGWCNIEVAYDRDIAINRAYTLYFGKEAVKDLVIPETVTEIKDYAFINCKIESLTLPEGLKTIGERAFFRCTELTEVSIPKSVTRIFTDAFRECTGLKTVHLVSERTTVASQLNKAFNLCDNLETITVSEGNKNLVVENNVLYNKNKDTMYFVPFAISGTVVLSDNLIEIPEDGFNGRFRVTDLVVPVTLESVWSRAFAKMTGLKNLYYMGTPEQWETIHVETDGNEDGGGNKNWKSAKVLYYSETAPTADGDFWHYVDNVPTAW